MFKYCWRETPIFLKKTDFLTKKMTSRGYCIANKPLVSSVPLMYYEKLTDVQCFIYIFAGCHKDKKDFVELN